MSKQHLLDNATLYGAIFEDTVTGLVFQEKSHVPHFFKNRVTSQVVISPAINPSSSMQDLSERDCLPIKFPNEMLATDRFTNVSDNPRFQGRKNAF